MRALVALALLVVSGCVTVQPHKEIPRAPTPDAPYDERARYLREYSKEEGDVGGRGFLQLTGGERLYWPEDLLPAVDEDSPTAKALESHVEHREEARLVYSFVSLPAMLSTLGSIVGVATAFSFAVSSGAFWLDPFFLGTSAWFVASLVAVGVAFWLESEPSRLAGETLHTAMSTYPQSLEDRLGLHVDGDGNIVDTTAGKANVFGVGGLGVRGSGDEPLGGLVGDSIDDEAPPAEGDLPPPLPDRPR